MVNIDRDILIPYLASYKHYLDAQAHQDDVRPLSNEQEDYKRGIASKAAEILESDRWTESMIGKGVIGNRAIKAVQHNQNLIGRFQVSAFSDKVRNNLATSERVLFDLYHNQKARECFEQICGLFGRKYDLVAYLYFILDPNKYLPLRSSIFDDIFKTFGIDFCTSGRCSWENYLEFLSVIEAFRSVMQDYYQIDGIDLLDAHSFLWTSNLNIFSSEGKINITDPENKFDIGVAVYHKDYGRGTISKITDKNIYVEFEKKLRIFPRSDAFDREYLKLI